MSETVNAVCPDVSEPVAAVGPGVSEPVAAVGPAFTTHDPAAESVPVPTTPAVSESVASAATVTDSGPGQAPEESSAPSVELAPSPSSREVGDGTVSYEVAKAVSEVHAIVTSIQADITSVKDLLEAVGPYVAALNSEMETKGAFGALGGLLKSLGGL